MLIPGLLILSLSITIQLYIFTRPVSDSIYLNPVSRCLPHTCQTPHLTTIDGYYISAFRILGTNPIILLPRFSGSGEEFLIKHSGTPISHLLARQHFDVSMLNLRGSIHNEAARHYMQGQSHDQNYSNPNFWNFTAIDSIALDLKAYMHMMVKSTNKTKADFIVFGQYGEVLTALLAAQADVRRLVGKVVWVAPGCKSFYSETWMNWLLSSRFALWLLEGLGVEVLRGTRSVFFGQVVGLLPGIEGVFGRVGSAWRRTGDAREASGFYETLATENINVKTARFFLEWTGKDLPDLGADQNKRVYGFDHRPSVNFSSIKQEFHLFVSSKCKAPDYLLKVPNIKFNKSFDLDLNSFIFSQDSSYYPDLLQIFNKSK